MSIDVASLVLGIFGVLALIPMVAKFVKSHLPSAQLRYFDQLVTETEGFLLSLEEQGTFREPITTAFFKERLSSIRHEAEIPRLKTYCATSPWQQLQGLFNGLSKKLARLGVKAVNLRAEISATATEELDRCAADTSTNANNDLPEVPVVGSACIDTTENVPDSDADQSEQASSSSSPSSSSSELSTTPSPTVDQQSSSPNHTLHLNEPALHGFALRPKKRHQSSQYARRIKRYLASRSLSSPSVARMEHRKSGVVRSDDFKRVLRTSTCDSASSSSTCVSEPDSLPLHMKLPHGKPVCEHEGT